MDRNKFAGTVIKTMLVVAGIGIAVVLVEAGLRWRFYARSGNSGWAQMHLYRDLGRAWKYRGLAGIELNRAAWAATFTERGRPVPPAGPRDGYWGKRIRPQLHPCGDLEVCERAQSIPLLVEIDERGFQHAGAGAGAFPRLLFVGGSVAFGAYSSSVRTAYFSVLLEHLEKDLPDLGISILARGGSVGMEDFQAFAFRGGEVGPDLVVFLNGFNDLTNRVGVGPDEGIRGYRRSVRLAAQLGSLQGLPVVFAMQPFLGGKNHKTSLERRVLDLTVPDYEERVNPWYRRLVVTARELAKREGAAAFLDYSDLLADEEETTFADQWHFSDFGHALLGEALARDLGPLLRETVRGPGERAPGSSS